MTQPNQSELVETVLSILGIVDRTSGNRPEQIATLEQELTAHINAEIARTLDRVEKEVVGEDEKEKVNHRNGSWDWVPGALGRNSTRAEQRQRLAALFGEEK